MMTLVNLDYYLRTENENELQHRQGHYTDYSKLQTYQSSHGETYYKFSVNSTSLQISNSGENFLHYKLYLEYNLT